jgi:acyl-CoA thioesterase-1
MTPTAAEPPPRLLALGDSLTAGYNLPAEDAFPMKLQARLARAGYRVQVTNAGVSGDTSAGGKARLDWILADGPPAYAIVELGANDALRGLDPKLTEANLDAILTRLQARGAKILLAGMMAPRNMGSDYAASFDAIYPRLQAAHRVALYPFFLNGVALHSDLTQADGLHPTARGVEVIVENILPSVEALLGSLPKEAP